MNLHLNLNKSSNPNSVDFCINYSFKYCGQTGNAKQNEDKTMGMNLSFIKINNKLECSQKVYAILVASAK